MIMGTEACTGSHFLTVQAAPSHGDSVTPAALASGTRSPWGSNEDCMREPILVKVTSFHLAVLHDPPPLALRGEQFSAIQL